MLRRYLFLLPLCSLAALAEPEVPAGNPLGMEFRRLASQRFVFNNNVPLTELDPTTVVALDLMHPYGWDGPADAPAKTPCAYTIEKGQLLVSNESKNEARSSMYIGGMNPFAVHEVSVESFEGAGSIGIDLGTIDQARRFAVTVEYAKDTKPRVIARYIENGKVRLEEILDLEDVPEAPYTFRVQMLGTGACVYFTKDGMCRLQGSVETVKHLDFREKTTFAATKFRLATRLAPGSKARVSSAKSYLSCGVGQADIRMVTHKDGSPYWHDDRLWFLFSARGWLLPHSTQGVLSLNPTVFDPRFEGTIVFDMKDGKLRNDVASHIFYDDDAEEWRGWSCNFSTVADGTNRKPSGINYIWSKRMPLKGFSVMNARAAENLSYKHEDPNGFWDAKAGKWRLLLSSFHEGIKASLWESDNWDGPFTEIAGPVPRDSTGTLIQVVNGTRYIFAGSSEQAVYVYDYPGLRLLGRLHMDYAPWNETVKNGRVWPNIFPAPEGSPYPYFALMMDRANFPKLKGWNYGALHLYGAVPLAEKR